MSESRTGKARIIPAWADDDSLSVRLAKSQGVSRADYARLTREIDETLETNIRAYVDSLDPDARELVLAIMRDVRENGLEESEKYKAIYEVDFRYKPVSIEQFLDDPYYLGQFTETLFPMWRRDLCNVFAPTSQVCEWMLGGAIGAGKTYTAAIAQCYQIYKMTCLRDPQRYYNLAFRAGKIVFGLYSVTMAQSTDVGYDVLRSFIEHAPYFSEKAPFNRRLLRRIDFLNIPVSVRVGSREFHALGANLFGLTMDEANFMQTASQKDKKRKGANQAANAGQAEKIYNASLARMKSRYLRPGGSVPGMMILISSKQDATSFMERRKKEAEPEIASGRVKLSEYSSWEVRPKKNYKLPTFFVEVGDRMYPSRVLKATTAEEAEREARPNSEVREIPGEMKVDFVNDTERALRDLAGVATFGMTPFIKERWRINECITDEWTHPFTRSEVSLSDADDVTLDRFFIPGVLFRTVNSKYVPRMNPHMPRAIHLDVAFTGDALGMACGHVAGKAPTKRVRENGEEYLDYMPIIHIDFMLRIVPPGVGEISLAKVRSFIQSLRDLGMPIGKITTDDYQSRDTRQILRTLGFETELLSMDRTDEPYMSLRGAIYERRVRFYDYPRFVLEVSRLERDLDLLKVDHPAMFDSNTPGSKDVSDAVGGVVHVLSSDEEMSLYHDGVSAIAKGYDPTRDGRTISASSAPDMALIHKVRKSLRR